MSKASALKTLGSVKSATRSKADEVWDYLHGKGYDLTRLWGMGSSGSEHPTGRAIDFMITGKGLGQKAGDLLAAYLWANRKRLQIKWLIWDRHIRSTSPGKSGNWEPYSGASTHEDHVHAFFGEGSYVKPPTSGGGSGSAKPKVSLKAVTAAAKADPRRPQGGTTSGASDDVKLVEKALVKLKLMNSRYAGDGSFGTITLKAYASWQRRCGFSAKDADGLPGEASLKKLGSESGLFTVTS